MKDTMHARVAAYLATHPNARNVEVAAATGVTPNYVSTIKTRLQMQKQHMTRFDVRGALARNPKVREWLFREKPDDVSVGDFIMAILTDAMNGD